MTASMSQVGEVNFLEQIGIVHGQRVLDVGFGSVGELIAIASLAGDHGSVIGLERDTRRIQQAQALLEQQMEGQRVSILQGCIEEIPLPNEHVDLVLCKGVLHEVRNIKRALDEMARVLQSGSTLTIIDFQRFSRLKFEFYRVLSLVLYGRSCGDLHPGFTPEVLQRLLTAHNVKAETETLSAMGRLGPYRIPLFLLKGTKRERAGGQEYRRWAGIAGGSA